MKNVKRFFYSLREVGFKKTIFKLILKFIGHSAYTQMNNFKSVEEYFKNKIGLEIGGPSNFFTKNGCMPIYPIVSRLDGVNFSSTTVWTGSIDSSKGYLVGGKCFGKQFILDATDLSKLDKGTYDFVLSCNNIEHVANPLRAIEQWVSMLKPNGVIVIVAPRKESNFDHNRNIVKFTHLLEDYNNNVQENDLGHLEEILKLHDLTLDPLAGTIEQFKGRSLKNFENRCLHQHVFDLNVLSEIYIYFKLSIVAKFEIQTDCVIIGAKDIFIKG